MSANELGRFAGYCVLFLLSCGALLLVVAVGALLVLARTPSYQRSIRMEKSGAVRERLHSEESEGRKPAA